MTAMTSLWQIFVPTARAQEQSSARTFCLRYSSQQIAQSVLGCQQHQLMCCLGPDSCSGHRVIRYEHHFTTLNIHLLTLTIYSYIGEKTAPTETFFSLTNLPAAH